MVNENYIEKLKNVKKDIEGFLEFEQKALNKWQKPKTQEQADKQREFTEPILGAIIAYKTSIGAIEKYSPELKENNQK